MARGRFFDLRRNHGGISARATRKPFEEGTRRLGEAQAEAGTSLLVSKAEVLVVKGESSGRVEDTIETARR